MRALLLAVLSMGGAGCAFEGQIAVQQVGGHIGGREAVSQSGVRAGGIRSYGEATRTISCAR